MDESLGLMTFIEWSTSAQAGIKDEMDALTGHGKQDIMKTSEDEAQESIDILAGHAKRGTRSCRLCA